MIKVSVILPVCNPGPGIERCIRSLRNQTLREIEMIFVDDLGTDDSMDLVRENAKEDPRIRILTNPENIGPGPSRNRGIEAARGEYLSFVDPDDYVKEDFLERLWCKGKAQDADIVKGERIRVDAAGQELANPGALTLNEKIREGLSDGVPLYVLFSFNHWTAIYRAAFIRESGSRYGTSRHGEDTTFLLRVCTATENISFDDDAVYYYAVGRPGQAMRMISPQRLENEKKAFAEQIDFINDSKITDRYVFEHILNRLNYYLSIHAAVVHTDIPKEAAEAYLHDLRMQIERMTISDELIKESIVCRGLIEFEADLCADYYYVMGEKPSPLSLRENELSRWDDFVRKNPKCGREYMEHYRVLRMKVFIKKSLDIISKVFRVLSER